MIDVDVGGSAGEAQWWPPPEWPAPPACPPPAESWPAAWCALWCPELSPAAGSTEPPAGPSGLPRRVRNAIRAPINTTTTTRMITGATSGVYQSGGQDTSTAARSGIGSAPHGMLGPALSVRAKTRRLASKGLDRRASNNVDMRDRHHAAVAVKRIVPDFRSS